MLVYQRVPTICSGSAHHSHTPTTSHGRHVATSARSVELATSCRDCDLDLWIHRTEDPQRPIFQGDQRPTHFSRVRISWGSSDLAAKNSDFSTLK